MTTPKNKNNCKARFVIDPVWNNNFIIPFFPGENSIILLNIHIHIFFINTSCDISKTKFSTRVRKVTEGAKNKKQSDRIFLNHPDQKAVNRCSCSDAFCRSCVENIKYVILPSQKPEFPARVFLGLRFGLAFGRGADGLLRIRQRGERGLVGGTQSLHQRLEFVFLQFKVQLHTAAQRHTTNADSAQ